MEPTRRSNSERTRSYRSRSLRGAAGSQRTSRLVCRRRYLVFLSYSGDAWLVSRIAEQVRQLGGEVWLDLNKLSGGDPISGTVREAIDSCNEAIVLLSPESLDSDWVVFEMGALWGQRKRITPILCHVGPKAIPVIPDVRGIDINEIDQQYLPDLADRIRKSGQIYEEEE
jgi:TIR domain-containing protein